MSSCRSYRFTVGGRKIELAPEDVRTAMADQEPERIGVWSTQVDDVTFPTKQTFNALTGMPRQSFTTQEAIRVLAKLGFPSQATARDGEPVDAILEARVRVLEAKIDQLMHRGILL